uniref:Uncharacterized protein n=1 Tax=Vitis vinifera TaxID=29760 RepID=F6H6X0_VITVI
MKINLFCEKEKVIVISMLESVFINEIAYKNRLDSLPH